MKYTIDTIKEILRQDRNRNIIYFWDHTPNPKRVTATCLSQWYDCWFVVDGVQYHTAEQYMMASKALLFEDKELFNEIMAAASPSEYKKLGRKIHDFDSMKWDTCKYDIVLKGNLAKFFQNLDLKEFLLSTGNAILAEASPYDAIWGIGLDKEQAEKGSVEDWRGENLLGCALMDVRDWLNQ